MQVVSNQSHTKVVTDTCVTYSISELAPLLVLFDYTICL